MGGGNSDLGGVGGVLIEAGGVCSLDGLGADRAGGLEASSGMDGACVLGTGPPHGEVGEGELFGNSTMTLRRD